MSPLEGLLSILVFTLLCTVLLLAYMFQDLSKRFRGTLEEFSVFKDLFSSLYYEIRRDYNKRKFEDGSGDED